jgi:hypothetical protein
MILLKYDSFQEKQAEMTKTVVVTEKKLKEAIAAQAEIKRLEKANEEDLDSYMNQLKKVDDKGINCIFIFTCSISEVWVWGPIIFV